jgi:uncharacterized repeat protein (TIGR02543 family)
MALFCACHNDILDALDNLDGRVTKLEQFCKEMNTNIQGLQAIVEVLQTQDYITNMVNIEKDGDVVGYTITFAKHEPITIYHGAKGDDGKDGVAPAIGVKQHTDGNYYWTINGEWLKDEDGNMQLVAAVMGITPLLKIEDGNWYISYDKGASWMFIGIAQGSDGATGDKGDKGEQGDPGESVFSSVTEDAWYVYFTLLDGTVLQVKKIDEQPNSEFIYTITYLPNGGHGAMPVDTFSCGVYTEVKYSSYTQEGYLFDGWNTEVDGSGYAYAPGTTITVVKNFVFYAQWKEKPAFTVGEFSISDTKKVAFSLGNLQYHPKNDTWRFAEKQTDCIGTDNKYLAADYDGWIDLFGWSGSTGSAKFGVSTSTTDAGYYGDFVDWGTNQIGEDAPNTWRTLTYDEWYYLINSRPDASTKMGVAQVDGVNGLILLPDNWECPSDITFKIGFHNDYGEEAYGLHQTFTADEWMLMEAAGAIFLPAAGYRSGTYVNSVQYGGSYWSATEDGSYEAYNLHYYSYGAGISYDDLYSGLSVRLVKDL